MMKMMARPWRGILFVIVALVLVAGACGNDDDDTSVSGSEAPTTQEAEPEDSGTEDTEPDGVAAEDVQLVFIYKNGTQQYFIDQGEGAKARAAELGLPEPRIVNVELDANLAINEINNAIATGASGVGITAPDQTIGPAVAQSTAAAGVALVATDDSLEDADGNPVPFIGFDGTDMGSKVGTAAATLLNEAGWQSDGSNLGIMSVRLSTLSVCNDRTNASEQMVKDLAGVTDDQIVPVEYDGNTDVALQAAGPVLTANNDITHWVVFSCNDEGVAGALRAMEAAGVETDNIIAVGLGAYLACPEWQAETDTGFRAALYISGIDVGAAAVEVLYEHIVNGVPLPLNTVANTTIVDPTNYEGSGLSC